MTDLPVSMMAMTYDAYGPLEGLRLRERPLPAVAADQVLLRVRAVGLHVADVFMVRGEPLPIRAVSGWRHPRIGVPGCDVAGEVVATGRAATRFKLGEAVFGTCEGGGCAEYASLSQELLVPLPGHLTFAQAAAVPTSGLAALHALRDTGALQSGQRVLIIGASGGVGTFAVQIAKALGAQVTGVCSTANEALVRGLGADHVVDYTRVDYGEGDARYDLILDNVESRPLSVSRRVLAPGGMLILNSGTGAQGLAMLVRLLAPVVLSPFAPGQRLRRYLSTPSQRDLLVLKELLESRRVTPVIDQTFPLRETVQALAHIERGHARGKVVIVL